MHRGKYPEMPPGIVMRIDTSNINVNQERIVNAVQCRSLLSGHWDCNDLMFSIVNNGKIFTKWRPALFLEQCLYLIKAS